MPARGIKITDRLAQQRAAPASEAAEAPPPEAIRPVVVHRPTRKVPRDGRRGEVPPGPEGFLMARGALSFVGPGQRGMGGSR